MEKKDIMRFTVLLSLILVMLAGSQAKLQGEAIPTPASISYPPDCDTAQEKHHYSIYSQEQLRIVHNLFGKWHREGISQAEYDTIWTYWKDATDIKKAYTYKAGGQLTNELWSKFLAEEFKPRSLRVAREVAENRALLKQIPEWSVKMEDLE